MGDCCIKSTHLEISEPLKQEKLIEYGYDVCLVVDGWVNVKGSSDFRKQLTLKDCKFGNIVSVDGNVYRLCSPPSDSVARLLRVKYSACHRQYFPDTDCIISAIWETHCVKLID